MTRLTICVLSAVLLLPAAAWAQETPEVAVVKVTGEGMDKDTALKDAMRKALEQGGKTEIYSHSQVENYALIRDTIYARAEGIITDYKIEQAEQGVGGVWYVTITAKVSKTAVATAWGEVQNVLDQIGRPKILVNITEKIDQVVDDSSIVEQAIEKRLVESGFDLVEKNAITEIKRREITDAAAEDNLAKMQALAKEFEADLFIAGHSHATAAGVEEAYDVPLAMYNCDVLAKAYYTDTARLLASEAIPSTRGGARGQRTHNRQAGKMALARAGQGLVDRIYISVMKQWCTQITAGGEIIMEIEGVNFAQAARIKKALAELEGIEQITGPKLTKGLARLTLRAKLGAQDLAMLLIEPPFDEMFEIQDVQLNRIQAAAVEP